MVDGRDFCRQGSFTRFEVSEKGILYTEQEYEQEMGRALTGFFSHRFPKFFVVVNSKKGCFVGKNRKCFFVKEKIAEIVKRLEAKLPVNNDIKEFVDFDEEMWASYYVSQFIKERRNKRLFNHSLPKKYRQMKGLVMETRDIRNKSLSEFC